MFTVTLPKVHVQSKIYNLKSELCGYKPLSHCHSILVSFRHNIAMALGFIDCVHVDPQDSLSNYYKQSLRIIPQLLLQYSVLALLERYGNIPKVYNSVVMIG